MSKERNPMASKLPKSPERTITPPVSQEPDPEADAPVIEQADVVKVLNQCSDSSKDIQDVGSVERWIDLELLDGSLRFQLCPEGSVDTLATSLVREGQLFAINVRPSSEGRFEIICGFRRVAALRLLMRPKVLARVHVGLSDADALSLALAALVESRCADRQMLEALRDRLTSESRLTPMIAEILTHAISPEEIELSPETIDGAPPSAVDPCALVQRLLERLAPLNQDLSQLAQCWDALPREVRETLLQQLIYPSDMARYLKRLPMGLF